MTMSIDKTGHSIKSRCIYNFFILYIYIFCNFCDFSVFYEDIAFYYAAIGHCNYSGILY